MNEVTSFQIGYSFLIRLGNLVSELKCAPSDLHNFSFTRTGRIALGNRLNLQLTYGKDGCVSLEVNVVCILRLGGRKMEPLPP